MINDKGFVDAYAAIYEKKEDKDKKRWQDDDGDGKWYEKSDVDGKISKREKDEKKSKKKDDEDDKDEDKKEEANEEVVSEVWGTVAKLGAKQVAKAGAKFAAKKGGKAAVKKAAISGAKHAAMNTAIDHATRGGDDVEESVKLEDAQGNPSVEILDLVLPDPIKSTVRKEETEVDELLESRLWDQVAANLTTLGEMRGIKYKVSPLDEGITGVLAAKAGVDAAGSAVKGGLNTAGKAIKATSQILNNKKATNEDVDIDAAMKQQSPFNVKSPVIFSNKTKVVEEQKEDLTSKYAPNIIKADASMKEGVGEIAGSVAGGAAGAAVAGPVGGVVGSLAGGALGSKLDKKKKKPAPAGA